MEQDLDPLEKEITKLGRPVGFSRESVVSLIDGIQPPPGSLIWTNSFAVLMLVPAQSNPEILRSVTQQAQEWLGLKITRNEERGIFVDGYLLIGLSAEPNDELRDVVSEIELNTLICRKHVLWSTHGKWEKAWTVTCLGLPDVQIRNLQRFEMPTLEGAAVRSLRFYEREKSYEAVADKLREEASAAAKRSG